MTWLKVGDEFTDETEALSGDAFRVHVQTLSLVMKLECGPVLPKSRVHRWVTVDKPAAVIAELVAHGFWRDLGDEDCYEVVHHMQHQPEPDVLAARRKSAAERQRRARYRAAGLPTPVGGRDE